MLLPLRAALSSPSPGHPEQKHGAGEQEAQSRPLWLCCRRRLGALRPSWAEVTACVTQTSSCPFGFFRMEVEWCLTHRKYHRWAEGRVSGGIRPREESGDAVVPNPTLTHAHTHPVSSVLRSRSTPDMEDVAWLCLSHTAGAWWRQGRPPHAGAGSLSPGAGSVTLGGCPVLLGPAVVLSDLAQGPLPGGGAAAGRGPGQRRAAHAVSSGDGTARCFLTGSITRWGLGESRRHPLARRGSAQAAPGALALHVMF